MTPNLAISLLRWWVGEKEIFRSVGSGSDWRRGGLVRTGVGTDYPRLFTYQLRGLSIAFQG